MRSHEIRERVRVECARAQNAFGPAFYTEHLAVVAGFAGRLAHELGADPEAVELAAYLHDLSAVRDLSTLPEHAARSATIAADLLTAVGLPRYTIQSVSDAIRRHSTPLAIGAASPEAVCLSNADAIAQIVRPVYWAYFAFSVRKLSYEAGAQWLEARVETNWRLMIEPARELAQAALTEAERERDSKLIRLRAPSDSALRVSAPTGPSAH